MDCNRCGHKNLPEARYCINCGMPMEIPQSQQGENKGKSLVPLVVVMLLIIVCLASIIAGYIYTRGGIWVKREIIPTPAPTSSVGEVKPSGSSQSVVTDSKNLQGMTQDNQEKAPTEDSTMAPIHTPTPVPAANYTKKDSFLSKAGQIEMYTDKYLETAMAQQDINRESGIVYQKWDDLLNEVYQYLKTIMPSADFERLKADEMAWVYEKEAAIEAEGALWEGGSGEPMARNMTGIDYTAERCYYLISLIR